MFNEIAWSIVLASFAFFPCAWREPPVFVMQNNNNLCVLVHFRNEASCANCFFLASFVTFWCCSGKRQFYYTIQSIHFFFDFAIIHALSPSKMFHCLSLWWFACQSIASELTGKSTVKYGDKQMDATTTKKRKKTRKVSVSISMAS